LAETNAIGRRVVLSLALGVFLASTAAIPALATHSRVGTGTPLRIPLAASFRPCLAPDTTHVAPLDYPGCLASPRITSEILTMSPRGVASGFAKLTVYCTDAAVPPCNPSNGTDTEDLKLRFSQTDVLCALGGVPGCTAAGADYTGQLVAQMAMRITDHSNGGAVCTLPGGSPPCVTATVQDKTFGFQFACVATSGANGSQCNANTTLDTIYPGMVKELQGAVVSLSSIAVNDQGPDGAVGGLCPPTCGTGDETRFLDQAVFAP
jgi:hypothetical protein